jgi:hypothetical protein
MNIAMKIIVSLAALLVAATPALAIGVQNNFSDSLKKMSSVQQRAVMRRAVLDHDQYCKQIGPVAYQGPYKNMEMWVVQCDRGAAYGAFIGSDGSVQVRPCADLVTFKLPRCKLPK